VFIAPTTRLLSHTRARKAASDAGATMPGVTDGSGECSPRRVFDVLGSGIWMTLSTTSPAGDQPVAVTNTGNRAGTEVVQCYVRDVAASVARPEQELRAFAKVALDPGQSASVIVDLDRRAFAFWDPTTHDWLVEPGEFEIRIGVSSRDIRTVASVTVTGS